MWRSGLRIASLFAAYSVVGFGGEYAVGLLMGEELDAFDVDRFMVEFDHDFDSDDFDIDFDVVVDVQGRGGAACEYEIEREVAISVSAGAQLRIDVGSGELSVEGRDGLDQVRGVARICASHEEFLDQLTVTTEIVDGDVVLVAHYPESRNWSGNRTARIDLALEVPRGMSVDIDDSSGDMMVSGTGDTRIDDSSGAIEVFDISGSLSIDDSSGELEIRDVLGDVDIEDGSGGLDIRDIGGSVHLRDGSGGIDVAGIGRDVVIESDGSGSIQVDRVEGDFSVGRDGSGSIRHSGVRGQVDIPRKERRRGN